MSPVEQLEARIYELEGIRVFVRALHATQFDKTYDFVNRARDDWTVKEWLIGRVEPITTDYDVVVLDGNANRVPGHVKLSNLRATYRK